MISEKDINDSDPTLGPNPIEDIDPDPATPETLEDDMHTHNLINFIPIN